MGVIDKIMQGAVLICALAMIIVVMVQVISRFALPQTPVWTEEAARICFIYMVSFGAGLAVKNKAYINVDTVFNLLPSKAKTIVQIIIHLLVIILMATVASESSALIRLGSFQQSPSLLIPMSYVFASMFILALFTGLYSILEIKSETKKIKTAKEEE